LRGGLVFRSLNSKGLVEPGCCTSLRDNSNWREGSDYRGSEWQMLWIGHPWVSVRYETSWLIVSKPHESDNPVKWWAVSPDDFLAAVTAAEAELERFAGQIGPVLTALHYTDHPERQARTLVGLSG
jgi:hypothetical protein